MKSTPYLRGGRAVVLPSHLEVFRVDRRNATERAVVCALRVGGG